MYDTIQYTMEVVTNNKWSIMNSLSWQVKSWETAVTIMNWFLKWNVSFYVDSPWTMKYYFYNFKNPTGRRASIQFKALFRVDINHTYDTSSNELLKSTMVYNNTYNHAYKHIK